MVNSKENGQNSDKLAFLDIVNKTQESEKPEVKPFPSIYLLLNWIVIAVAYSYLLFSFLNPVENNESELPLGTLPSKIDLITASSEIPSNSKSFTAYATPRMHTSLSPPLEGDIITVTVREGDLVEKGQVLAELINEQLNFQMEIFDQNINELLVEKNRVELNSQHLQEKVNKFSQLIRTKSISELSLDDIENEYRNSILSLQKIKRVIEQKQIALKDLHNRSNRMTLKAPYKGVISQVNGNPGERYERFHGGNFGGKGVIRMYDPESIELKASISVEAFETLGEIKTISFKGIKGNVQFLEIRSLPTIVDRSNESVDIFFVSQNSPLQLLPNRRVKIEMEFYNYE